MERYLRKINWYAVLQQAPRYLFVSFVVFGLISVAALRHNYHHMDELRQQVYAMDQQGGNVEGALQDLRGFVTTHMNTNLTAGVSGVYPPIQLKYTYQRLVTAAGQQTSDSNSQVYADAQKYCEGQIPTGFSGRYRLSCIENYVDQHGTGNVTTIPDSLYKFDFVSPSWSPDLAGLSILFALVSLAGLLLLTALRWWLYGPQPKKKHPAV